MFLSVFCIFEGGSRSRKGAWIEISIMRMKMSGIIVAPARERGLKLCVAYSVLLKRRCRSRKGAWIEIPSERAMVRQEIVAPARERGLKWRRCITNYTSRQRRSRKGAWIEINPVPLTDVH